MQKLKQNTQAPQPSNRGPLTYPILPITGLLHWPLTTSMPLTAKASKALGQITITRSPKSNQPGEKEWYLSNSEPSDHQSHSRPPGKKKKNTTKNMHALHGFFLESLTITLGQQYTHKGHMYKCLQNVVN